MWLVLALVAALCQVLRNTVMKRLGHSLDEYINVWGRFTFLLPFAAAFVWCNGAPPIKPGFVPACLSFAVCQIISTMSLSKALKLSDISMVTALEGEPAGSDGDWLPHAQGDAFGARGGGHPRQHGRRLSLERQPRPPRVVGAADRAVHRPRTALDAPCRALLRAVGDHDQ